MESIKINIRSLGSQENFIKIPLGQSFVPMDNAEIAENKFLEDAIQASINPIEDYEKIKFVPYNGVDEIIISLKTTGGAALNYNSFGHSDDDLFFLRNSFKNSFIKLNFYDSPNPSNRRLAFQSIVYNQVNIDQRDPITYQPLPTITMPITYRIVDPIRLRNGISEGFYMYWLKNPQYNSYPINFFMTAAYHNALDGIITPLMAYDYPNIPVNVYNGFNFVKYTLVSLNNINEYHVKMDDTKTGYDYRTISNVGSKLNIDFYIPDLLW